MHLCCFDFYILNRPTLSHNTLVVPGHTITLFLIILALFVLIFTLFTYYINIS